MSKKAEKIFIEALICVGGAFLLLLYMFISGLPLVAGMVLLVVFAYVRIIEHQKTKKTNILHLAFLFLIGLAMIIFVQRYAKTSPYYIPLPAIAMLVVILFSSVELSLLLSLCLSLCAGFIFQADLYLASIVFLGSMIASFFVYRIRQRYKIMQAGVVASLVMAVALLTISYRKDVGILSFLSPHVLPVCINGILSAFLVSGALPLFEFLFRMVSNISLLELSDFNHPLLKRLVLEAPGTYHHSLLVGNLTEMAAEAINANALLARVGSYYHDIGKLEKPEYFSENQDQAFSRHQQLKASMSKLVIINHVKHGLLLAKKYKLNAAVADFIEQHHGTSLVFYFYRRALEESKEKDDIKEEVFRYNGPKPQTKETAIVLLADSVEAACRALEDPNAQRIDEVVRTVINNKFIDGQLDDCDLTLKDLDRIAKTFVRILSAIYHSRVEYPDIANESTNKESTKKAQNKLSPHKENS